MCFETFFHEFFNDFLQEKFAWFMNIRTKKLSSSLPCEISFKVFFLFAVLVFLVSLLNQCNAVMIQRVTVCPQFCYSCRKDFTHKED